MLERASCVVNGAWCVAERGCVTSGAKAHPSTYVISSKVLVTIVDRWYPIIVSCVDPRVRYAVFVTECIDGDAFCCEVQRVVRVRIV